MASQDFRVSTLGATTAGMAKACAKDTKNAPGNAYCSLAPGVNGKAPIVSAEDDAIELGKQDAQPDTGILLEPKAMRTSSFASPTS